MICRKCGADNKDTNSFCVECGAPIMHEKENSRASKPIGVLAYLGEHKIIHSNGMIYSRAALTGITAVNGTTILSGIIIPGVITPLKITITPRAIIILHGITILKRITTYRLHPRQINPMLKHQKKSH